MPATSRWSSLVLLGLVALGAGSYAAADTITLALPSSASSGVGLMGAGNPVGLGQGVGSDGAGVSASDYVTQTYFSTGLPSTDASHWVFDMSTWSAAGVTSTFDALINGTTVGSYTVVGTGSNQTVHLDLNFTSPVIKGDTYTLRTQSRSSSGGVTWAWLAGGSAVLESPGGDAVAAPLPSTAWGGMALLGVLVGAVRPCRRSPQTA